MRKSLSVAVALVTLVIGLPSIAQEPRPLAPPPPLLREIVQGMPKGDRQEVRVFAATVKPGEKTPFHSNQAMVEPPHVKMTGYNRSGTEPVRAVLFYVSDPDTPFFDVAQ